MSVDIDAIRASRAACADIPWSCPCVSGEQLDALIEEVERLRSERSLLEQEARIRRRLCSRFAEEVKQLREVEEHMVLEIVRLRDEVQAERAAVVAWLREEFDTDSVRMAADEIERGEHRREEER